MGNDRTVASFPTYAELTQTQAWGERVPRRIASAMESVDASDVSQGSRYTESAVLGVGGMGKVLLARDERIGRDIALKLLHAEHELSEEERERFLREAQVQGQLEHPSIVPVYDVDRREDGTTFFTMRRVLGKTLSTILQELRDGNAEARARYTQRELLQAFATVCLAIDYAHSRGVVHRDLKPANIMLGDFGEVYVLDWGLARIVDPEASADSSLRLSLPGAVMGTPLYMAPEQMADPAVGPAADVFSLGAILFEILTLQRLRDARAVYAPVEARPSVRVPDRNVAPELETICVRATALALDDRYSSARALQEAVARYLEGDRELESRRALAAKHVEKARDALAKVDEGSSGAYEEHRTTAMRELLRALALDPTDRENVAMFARIFQAPPNVVPEEVKQQITASSQAMIHLGAKFSTIAMASWFCFLPVIIALGVRRLDYLLGAAVPAALTGILSFVAWRQKTISRAMQMTVVCIMMFAGMALSRMYGPMILAPTLLATWSVIMQAHPEQRMRIFALVAGAASTALPVLLELAGLLPASYVFEGGRMQIVPQMHELPRELSLGFLMVANVAVCILPALFIARLRGELARAQRRELVQTWHFRRLGDDLVRAAA